MNTSSFLSRRKLLSSVAIGGGALLSGCDRLNDSPAFRDVLSTAEDANFTVQRALGDRAELAREYAPSERSPTFRANGTKNPDNEDYQAMAANGFADWRVIVRGMVERPLSLSVDDIKAMPQRSQITRHDCVEGWSAIGKWTGVPLKLVLDIAKPLRSARYVVFHCVDTLPGGRYYESIDMIDARHPQTIIAHQLNDEDVPIKNGAPLRMRVERQLGYKHAKYLTEIELVDRLDDIYGGKGGYWEDRADYQWYAGI